MFSRKNAREQLFKLVFENLFIDAENTFSYEEFLENDDISQEQKEYIKDNFTSILKNKDDLIEKLKNVLDDNFSVERIFKIDMAILLVAVNELLYYKQTPIKVVVNEAVEMSKKYSTDKSYSFINGVLAKIIKANSLD